MKKLFIGTMFMVVASALSSSVFAAEVKSIEKYSENSWWVTCTSGRSIKVLYGDGRYVTSEIGSRYGNSLEEVAKVWCKYDGN